MKNLLLIIMLSICISSIAQIELTVSEPFENSMRGGVAFYDFNNDNNGLDAFIAGFNSIGTFPNNTIVPQGLLYEYINGNFPTNPTSSLSSGLDEGDITFFDYNNDQLMDIAFVGYEFIKIYRNDGGYNFIEVYSDDGLPTGSIASLDYDADGDLDLYITGEDSNTSTSTRNMFLNNNNNTFVEVSTGPITPTKIGDVKSVDLNNDGFDDLIITGSDNVLGYGEIWQNNGSGSFTLATNLLEVGFSSISIADLNNDNLIDIAITGSTVSDIITVIYENNDNFSFTLHNNTNLPQVYLGAIEFADFNYDDNLDVVIQGKLNGGQKASQIYLNISDFNFELEMDLNFDLHEGNFALADYDIDGDIDILQNGNSNECPFCEPKTYLYTNITDTDGDGIQDGSDTEINNPCVPIQPIGYTGYNSSNTIWRSANCDNDSYTNGEEYDCGSDPYDNLEDCGTLNTIDYLINSVKIYPNPTNGLLNITVSNSSFINSISIYNAVGNLVYKSEYQPILNLSNLSTGIYFMEIQTDLVTMNKKIIIKK